MAICWFVLPLELGTSNEFRNGIRGLVLYCDYIIKITYKTSTIILSQANQSSKNQTQGVTQSPSIRVDFFTTLVLQFFK